MPNTYQDVKRSVDNLDPHARSRLITELVKQEAQNYAEIRPGSESEQMLYGELIEEVCQNLTKNERSIFLRLINGETPTSVAQTLNISSIAVHDSILRMAEKNPYVALWSHQHIPGPEHGRSLLELQGLGRDIWKTVDVAEYIDQERSSWSG